MRGTVPCRRVACVVLLLAVLLLPADGAAALRGGESFRQYTEQGIHYYRKKKLEAARQALEQAYKLPGGSTDFDTLSTLAHVYFDLDLLEKAIPLIRRCTEVIESGEDLEQCQLFLRSLLEGFGEVTLLPATAMAAGSLGFVHLKCQKELINLKRKKIFEDLSGRLLAEPVQLPLTIYLPFGAYTANDVPIVIERRSKPLRLVVPLKGMATGTLAAAPPAPGATSSAPRPTGPSARPTAEGPRTGVACPQQAFPDDRPRGPCPPAARRRAPRGRTSSCRRVPGGRNPRSDQLAGFSASGGEHPQRARYRLLIERDHHEEAEAPTIGTPASPVARVSSRRASRPAIP